MLISKFSYGSLSKLGPRFDAIAKVGTSAIA